MMKLPIELEREIVKFTPRHPTAQIMYESRHTLSLNYVRKYKFKSDTNPYYQRMFIWEDLEPACFESIFYGDTKMITRSNISKGQYIKLRSLGIVY